MIKIFIGTSDTEDKWIEQIYLYSLYMNTDAELDIRFLRPKMFKDWNRMDGEHLLLVSGMQYLNYVILKVEQFIQM